MQPLIDLAREWRAEAENQIEEEYLSHTAYSAIWFVSGPIILLPVGDRAIPPEGRHQNFIAIGILASFCLIHIDA